MITRRNVLVVTGLEVLIFLLPTEGKVEGLGIGYWDGVRLRLASGNYWARAILCGIGAAMLVIALDILARYLQKFVDPPSKSDGAGGPDKNSLA